MDDFLIGFYTALIDADLNLLAQTAGTTDPVIIASRAKLEQHIRDYQQRIMEGDYGHQRTDRDSLRDTVDRAHDLAGAARKA